MNYYTLLDEVKQYVTSYFHTHANDKLVYHNLVTYRKRSECGC